MKVPKIPITRYLTINSTEEAHNLVEKYGYKPVSYQQLFHSLNDLLHEKGEEALREFALIHPDREIIIARFGEKQQEAESKFSNANGMDFTCDKEEKTSNLVETNATVSDVFTFDFKKQLPYIVGGAMAITIMAILIKKI
jgi:hypothetical protein